MAKEYLDKDGLLYFWQKIKNTFALVSHTHTKSQITDFPTIPTKTSDLTNDSNFVSDASYVHTDNNYTSTEKTKLSGIASGAEVNQNAFSNVKVGSTTVAADGKTDTLELVAGSNVTLTPDATNDKVTIAATDTVYTHPTYTAATAAAIKVGRDSTGHVVTGAALTKSDVGLANVDNTADANKAVLSATKLATARTIDGVSFDGQSAITHYGVCSTLGGTAAKTVDCTGFTLVTGAQIIVKFTNENTSAWSGVTLNVNGTGAKAIKYRGETPTPMVYSQVANSIFMFVYDGTNYEVVTDLNKVNGIKGSAESSYRSGNVNLTAANIGAVATSAVGAASGVCPLNASSKIDSTYLPSYVDDVIEAYARSGQTALSSTWLATGSASGTVITPETGKIYVLMADSGDYAANTQFRWSGTAYVKLADGGVSSITNAEIDTIVAS